ncbi:MAG TPA: AMP-binding protein, partial [Xanthomonadales bacterium]|nr:AMP-binding protein [Xanthomonadales bacterium]
MFNISTSLGWATQRFGARDALVCGQRRWTYAELNRDVHALAAGLRAQGIEAGDRIATVAQNSAEYLLLALALARLGAVLVPLNYRLKLHELVELIRRSGAVALATEAEFSAVSAATAELAALQIRLDLASGLAGDPVSIPALIETHQGQRFEDFPCETNTLLRIMYTSGTTSLPKGVRITHGNCWANMHAHAVEFSITHQDRLLLAAPLYHVGGFDIPGLTLFHVGGCIVLMRRFDAEQVLATIASERITGTTLVATMMNMLLEVPEPERFDTSSMRWIIFGQVTRTLFERALDLFPTAALTEGYGMTEACGGVAYVDAGHRSEKLGSVGLAVQGMEIIVADADDQPLP